MTTTLTQKLDALGIHIKKFTGNVWYVIGINIFILLCWVLNFLYLGIAAFIIGFILVLLTQKNINAILPVLASVVFIVAETGGGAWEAAVRPAFFDTLSIVLYCCLPLLLGALIYFFLKNKIKIRFGSIAKGLLIFFIFALFAGAGSQLYTLSVVLKTLLFCLAIFGAYILFFSAFDFRAEGFKRYFAFSFTGSAVVVAAEVFIAYMRQGEGVFVGWGNGGTAGQILVMYLPFIFYLLMTAKNKREMILYYVLIAVIAGALLLSRSRAAMVALVCLIVPIFIITHKRLNPEFKKTNLILLAGLFAAGLLFFAIKSEWMIGQIKSFIKAGGDVTSGRIDVWTEGWEFFLENPIFGKGFLQRGSKGGISYEEGFIFIYWYHNTVLQILVNMGLVGLAAFSYFMYKKYTPFFRKGDIFNFFIFAGVIIAEIQGLLDPHVVTLGHSIFMLLFVAGAEQLTGDGGEYWFKKDVAIKEVI